MEREGAACSYRSLLQPGLSALAVLSPLERLVGSLLRNALVGLILWVGFSLLHLGRLVVSFHKP